MHNEYVSTWILHLNDRTCNNSRRKISTVKYSVFMKIFRREEVTSDWRKLADDLLYDLFSLSYNIRIIKLRSMK